MIYRERPDGTIESCTVDQWTSDTDRKIVQTSVPVDDVDDGIRLVHVSTVFLCLDHNHWNDGPPVLYETMLFCDWDRLSEECWRYTTRDKAEAAHEHICGLIRNGLLDELDEFEPFVDPQR